MSIPDLLNAFVTNSGLPPEPIATQLTLQAARETIPRMLDVSEAAGAQRPQTEDWSKFTHPSAPELGALLDKYTSDKATPHKYHHLYAHLMGARREEALNIFEVGLGSNNPAVTGSMPGRATASVGASLRAWRDFFPRASVYGADVDRGCLFDEARIRTFYVDQTQPETFMALGLPELDLVIDDGLHSPHANLATLAFGMRKMRPWGAIVIEDVSAFSLPIWQLVAEILAPTRWIPTIIQADTGGRIFVAQRRG